MHRARSLVIARACLGGASALLGQCLVGCRPPCCSRAPLSPAYSACPLRQERCEASEVPQHLRARPAELVPGTQRVISVKMNYLPPDASFAKNLKQTDKAYISRYALGRDYHKLIRNRLKKLGQKIEQQVGQLGFRPFVDSAPVLERQLAEKAGLGWRGKHSLLINKEAGSWFFLGELFVDIPLPIDDENSFEGCGKYI